MPLTVMLLGDGDAFPIVAVPGIAMGVEFVKTAAAAGLASRTHATAAPNPIRTTRSAHMMPSLGLRPILGDDARQPPGRRTPKTRGEQTPAPGVS
jgi:hypothetical protein